MSIQRNPVGWFEIYVHDMSRAKLFYERMLNIQLSKLDTPVNQMEMLTFPGNPDQPGSCGALVKMQGKVPGDGGPLIYFSCIDCAVNEENVKKAGGKVHLSKMSIDPYGFITLVGDTEGNTVGLHSRK